MQVVTVQEQKLNSKQRKRRRYAYNVKLRKARKLTVESFGFDGYSYTVRGGTEDRLVEIVDTYYNCSCGNANSKCSHILAVQIHLGLLDNENTVQQ